MIKQNFQKFIKQALSSASKIANNSFGNITSISTKSGDNNQVLTETDLEIGEYLIGKVKSFFPDHNIIDEEAGVVDNGHEYTWVIDPIDGTSNFASGLPTYGVMIGLLKGDQALAGGISLPAFNQILVAEKGKGAFCNEEKIFVSKEKKLLSSLIAYGIDGHQENHEQTMDEAKLLGKIILNIRNLRTTNSAYDMAQVSMGKYGAYLNKTTKIWDNVALQPIVEEAGGVVTDFWGNPMDYSNSLQRSQENFTICAGASDLHGELQRVINGE